MTQLQALRLELQQRTRLLRAIVHGSAVDFILSGVLGLVVRMTAQHGSQHDGLVLASGRLAQRENVVLAVLIADIEDLNGAWLAVDVAEGAVSHSNLHVWHVNSIDLLRRDLRLSLWVLCVLLILLGEFQLLRLVKRTQVVLLQLNRLALALLVILANVATVTDLVRPKWIYLQVKWSFWRALFITKSFVLLTL